VRKVVGAGRQQLIRQFLLEALLMSGAAAGLALALVWLALPAFGNMVQSPLSVVLLGEPAFVLAFVAGVVLVGLLAGLYPAVVLSGFKPISVLKGAGLTGNARGHWLRKGLVVVQFSISIMLFIGTGILYSQVDYLLNKDLGFDKEQLVVVDVSAFGRTGKYQTFVDALVGRGDIIEVTTTESIPGRFVYDYYLRPEDMPEEETVSLPYLWTDRHFADVFGLTFLRGEEESKSFQGIAYVLNETAVRQLGWEDDPIGKEIYREQQGRRMWQGTVTGVVEDFHFRSLHQPIQPLILAVIPATDERRASYGYATFRIKPDRIPETIAAMEEQWKALAPEWDFTYHFLDENLAQLYQSEADLRRLITNFALLALLIACLGLFGLSSYTVAQRTKEIGVRKVLGASSPGIALVVSRECTLLSAGSCGVAAPLA
jgi:putative ABC transport system permease protein